MRILLDTHIFYCFIEGDPQLSALASSTISDPANEVLLSPSSYWEIAIKVSMGKWRLHRPYDELRLDCVHGQRILTTMRCNFLGCA